MTNKEAIEYLKEAQSHIDLEMGGNTQNVYDAIDMAIGKLQANDEQVTNNLYEAMKEFLKNHTIVELLEVLKDVIQLERIRE